MERCAVWQYQFIMCFLLRVKFPGNLLINSISFYFLTEQPHSLILAFVTQHLAADVSQQLQRTDALCHSCLLFMDSFVILLPSLPHNTVWQKAYPSVKRVNHRPHLNYTSICRVQSDKEHPYMLRCTAIVQCHFKLKARRGH